MTIKLKKVKILMTAKKQPLILVCNDDGIFSKGIKALADVASEFGEVQVVAPDRQQSAVGSCHYRYNATAGTGI